MRYQKVTVPVKNVINFHPVKPPHILKYGDFFLQIKASKEFMFFWSFFIEKRIGFLFFEFSLHINSVNKIFSKSGGQIMEKKVYTVTDIQTILGLSRTKAYDFIKNVYNSKKPFPVIKIDSTYRIPKDKFDKWFYSNNF